MHQLLQSWCLFLIYIYWLSIFHCLLYVFCLFCFFFLSLAFGSFLVNHFNITSSKKKRGGGVVGTKRPQGSVSQKEQKTTKNYANKALDNKREMTINEPAPAFAITMKEPYWYWALAMVCFALMNQTTKANTNRTE